MRTVFGIVSLALLASCQQPAELKVDGAWVRLPAVAANPGAGYFTIQGGDKADVLLEVSTPAALRVEMHESMKGDHGMMAMHAIQDVAVPARTALTFEPGAKHIMLFDVGPQVKVGESIPLSLSFASGTKIDVQAKVVAPGEGKPE